MIVTGCYPERRAQGSEAPSARSEAGAEVLVLFGDARGETRTLTGLPPRDFESRASTSSTTRALGPGNVVYLPVSGQSSHSQ